MIPVFFGLEGPVLTDAERALFRAVDPAGYILFQRNCVDPEQVRALTDSLKALSGRGESLPILIDQEGGRVARLRPPHWPEFPAARRFAELYEVSPVAAMDAARLNARAIAAVVRSVGVTVDCLPVLDVPVEGAHDVIGDRAYGFEARQVAALGRATLDGLRDGGWWVSSSTSPATAAPAATAIWSCRWWTIRWRASNRTSRPLQSWPTRPWR